MKNLLKLTLLWLLVGGVFAACEEVKEVDRYENWQKRNEAFADSLDILAAGRLLVSAADADQMVLGQYYAIETSASNNKKKEYIYVKKLLDAPEENAIRPYYTDRVSAFYYGSMINGDRVDGNFQGYGSNNQSVLDGGALLPTQFDTPTDFVVTKTISGWISALQYMRVGERWMVFVPYASAYGSKGSGSVMGYTLLGYDMMIHKVYNRD